MLDFLRFWNRNRRRQIFRYWDGKRTRVLDPLAAWRQLWEDPDCSPERDFGPACGIAPNGQSMDYDPAAQDRVLTLARKMFGVEPWTEKTPRGLTVNETFELLWGFMSYMDGLKKKRDQLLTSSARSDSTSSVPTSESLTTPSESDSSSISPGSSLGEQPVSAKHSVQL